MDKEKFLEEFNRQQHRLGRIMLISAALLLLAVPFMLGAIYGAFPDFKGFINGFIKVGIVYIPVGIVEFLVYAPMLGNGVLLLVPLTPVLENPVLTPAFDTVVPALFGALGLKYFKKSMKIAAIPLLSMTLLCVFVPAAISQTSILLIPAGGMALLIGYILWKKDKL